MGLLFSLVPFTTLWLWWLTSFNISLKLYSPLENIRQEAQERLQEFNFLYLKENDSKGIVFEQRDVRVVVVFIHNAGFLLLAKLVSLCKAFNAHVYIH